MPVTAKCDENINEEESDAGRKTQIKMSRMNAL